jgi:hypothetical protein
MVGVLFILLSKRSDEHSLFALNAVGIGSNDDKCYEYRGYPVDGGQSCPNKQQDDAEVTRVTQPLIRPFSDDAMVI